MSNRTRPLDLRDLEGFETDSMMTELVRALSGDVPHAHASNGRALFTREEIPLTLLRGPREVHDLQTQGAALVRSGQFDAAYKHFREAITKLVGDGVTVPLSAQDGGGVRSEMYIKMDTFHLIIMLGLCDNIAECLLGSNKVEEALSWLEESNTIFKNNHFRATPVFEWYSCALDQKDFFLSRTSALTRASNVFISLGNTSAAVGHIWSAHCSLDMLPPSVVPYRRVLEGIVPRIDADDRMKFRHPDPKINAKLRVTVPELQVLGSWQKVELPKDAQRISTRISFCSFVWGGRFYVAGGQKGIDGPFYRDLQYIDIKKMDTWVTLPAPPARGDGQMLNWKMCVDEETNKAYLYTGRLVLDVFDLQSQTWSELTTTWASPDRTLWPFSRSEHFEYSMILVQGTLYVFGGTLRHCVLGCDLLMALDLKTRRWHKLSGDPASPTPDPLSPGPRRNAAMWVDGQKKKIWIMFGEADRQSARQSHQANGAQLGYGYDDCWTWDIAGKFWQRERVAGNPPCARSEMGNTFNTKLNMAVVFGGYSPNQPTWYPAGNTFFPFTYHGDTFIYDATPADGTAPKWKLVISKGFPTYRAQAALFSDPDTGKTFLFGGYTNSDFVPSKKHVFTRSFNDLWQLKLDVPGGYFEGVDVEEEARTAKAGPWQRCFNCGNAGPWKKCGGSCGGRAFFCENQCLKEGWKEHKTMHTCARK
ncbi:hypothetical protein FA95DRAFT_1591490 [Auriscalpium vulgare]|uniref:Uncharacterized protein n=1 Tax=Auriscalpium vulgare TaxID=40419 RepID=A0ACB8R753_9AGAM|nr:hypothetical protein FA95DRAFT_1591490 [Auriscalpium vulgare]